MRQIDHPNIIKLIDFAESRQYYYIILELAPGGELFHQIVRLTYFSEDLSRHVITQVAKALEYLHEERGIVHRYDFFFSLAGSFVDEVISGTSNRKISSSAPFRSYPQRTPSLSNLGMKTRSMRENSSGVWVAVALGRSRSPILVSPRLYGKTRP